jgi:lipopolysaccharide transport system permease protein
MRNSSQISRRIRFISRKNNDQMDMRRQPSSADEAGSSSSSIPSETGAVTNPLRSGFPAARRKGNFAFVVASLVMRDFRVRYRNMSLGILWSLANPLIMMLVLTFVFKNVFPNSSVRNYPAFALIGLISYNFFGLAWSSSTTSISYNAGLIKRVRMMREIIPIASVLAQSIHFLIQIVLVLIFVAALGLPPTRQWLWTIPIIAVELVWISGLALLCSAFDVYLRDTRYVVDSTVTVMFWLTPVFYPVEMVPLRYRAFYELNPIASVIVCLRNVLLDAKMPSLRVLGLGALVSIAIFSLGLFVFGQMKGNFGDYL